MPFYPDPNIPYVHGRDLLPIRKIPIDKHNRRFAEAFAEEDALREEINQLDEQVVRLSARRRELLERIAKVHDRIRPRVVGMAGRRRRVISHDEPLPPASDDARYIVGCELRSICLGILARRRAVFSLRQIHVILHRVGYIIAHKHPVKALADALGHEADIGRAIRVKRGYYEAAPDLDIDTSMLPDF